MSKTCEHCGTELLADDIFCPECGKGQSDIPENATALSMRKGSLILPRNRLSLLSVILILSGAISLLFYCLLSLLNFDLSLFVVGNLTVIGAIFWFVARFTGMRLKIPILLWGCATVIRMFAYISSVNWYFENEYLFYGVYYSVFILINIAVVLFAFLYSIHLIRRTAALIIIGVFILAITSVYLFNNITANHGFSAFFELIYILTFLPGIFLSILSAKVKPSSQIK